MPSRIKFILTPNPTVIPYLPTTYFGEAMKFIKATASAKKQVLSYTGISTDMPKWKMLQALCKQLPEGSINLKVWRVPRFGSGKPAFLTAEVAPKKKQKIQAEEPVYGGRPLTAQEATQTLRRALPAGIRSYTWDLPPVQG